MPPGARWGAGAADACTGSYLRLLHRRLASAAGQTAGAQGAAGPRAPPEGGGPLATQHAGTPSYRIVCLC